MAYGRSSDGRELLSDRNVSNVFVLSFILDCGWRLGDCGLNKDNPGSRGNIRR